MIFLFQLGSIPSLWFHPGTYFNTSSVEKITADIAIFSKDLPTKLFIHGGHEKLRFPYDCTYAPMIYTALCIMFWMRAYPLRGEVGGGWALEFSSFLGL
jgi:hypothetical protein